MSTLEVPGYQPIHIERDAAGTWWLYMGSNFVALSCDQWRQFARMIADAESADGLGRIRALEDNLRGALLSIRTLDRLRPTCVLCHDATADRQTLRGPACSDCVGDLPDDGPDPDRPETWAFPGPEEFGQEAAQ